jgi:hypothetical protein
MACLRSLASVSPRASCTQPDTALRRLLVVMALLNCHGPMFEKLVPREELAPASIVRAHS